jgi:GTP-binding protein Era
LNLYCGNRVAITSPVPQTTRDAIRGIVTRSAPVEGQLVFIDTPGLHLSTRKFNLRLRDTALKSLEGADLVLYLLDASREGGAEERAITEILRSLPDYENRLAAAVNKIDKVKTPEILDRWTAFLSEELPLLRKDNTFFISCLEKSGTEELLERLFRLAPEGEAWYDGDVYTDQDLNFRLSEIIRGEAIAHLREELPHAIFVSVADTELRPSEVPGAPETLWVRAFIHVERESQKGMVVGKGGKMIRAIRLGAIREIVKILDWRVNLDLRVKTGWLKEN